MNVAAQSVIVYARCLVFPEILKKKKNSFLNTVGYYFYFYFVPQLVHVRLVENC